MVEVSITKELKGLNIDIDFSLHSRRGVIFGPSGSGKSSILKMIAGFYPPDEGKIILDGNVFFSSKKRVNMPINKRNIGYLPQEYTLFPHMTIRENILYGIKVKREKIDKNFFDFLVSITEMKNHLDSYPGQISGGQKQRAALLRAIMVKPRLLLLDEPFSALDKPIREELRDLVIELSQKFDIPVLFVTHDIDEAFVFSEEVILIKNGNIVQYGLKPEVFNRPTNIDAAKLLNFKNIWEVEESKNNLVKIQGRWIETQNTALGFPSYCCIKPENVLILREDVDISDKENKITGKITSIHHRTGYVLINFESENFKVQISTPPHVLEKMDLREGKNITISLKKEALILVK